MKSKVITRRAGVRRGAEEWPRPRPARGEAAWQLRGARQAGSARRRPARGPAVYDDPEGSYRVTNEGPRDGTS